MKFKLVIDRNLIWYFWPNQNHKIKYSHRNQKWTESELKVRKALTKAGIFCKIKIKRRA